MGLDGKQDSGPRFALAELAAPRSVANTAFARGLRDRLVRLTGCNWSHDSAWGRATFDLWCHKHGLAVMIDAPGEALRDVGPYAARFGIVVVRVRVGDAASLDAAIARLCEVTSPWSERREAVGRKPVAGAL